MMMMIIMIIIIYDHSAMRLLGSRELRYTAATVKRLGLVSRVSK